jgi:hypothetical protein
VRRYVFHILVATVLLASAEQPTQAAGAAVTPLPRLVADGRWFKQDNGARWTGIEATDFNLFNRFLNGEDITPILGQRADVGFNLLRVWTDFDVCADRPPRAERAPRLLCTSTRLP